MERITVSLPSPQMSWLKHEAERVGITVGELLRRIIDQHREAREKKAA
jgi:hypothetical protein